MGAIDLQAGAIGVTECSAASTERLPILFLHGVGSTRQVWRPQLAWFGASRRAIALDYPGYGESAPRADAGHDGFAAAMLEVVDALGIDRLHVCGLSLGGVVAIAMHHLAPVRCASLILADSFATHPDGAAIYERSVGASRSLGMRALAETRAPSLLGAATPDAIKAEIVETMAGIAGDAYRIGAAAVWLADQRDRAAAIRCPALVLVGDEDRITPPALSEQLAGSIPGARLATIAGAGHLGNIERPEAFNRLVGDFIAETEAKL